ncbi:MAG TPA: arginine--tRNA ligase [Candidatus Acidoferrum sp.]|nr:arginine--tRNA ligase [Candidatus Acidoferrum sp.]
MFHSIEKQVARAFHAHIQARYGVDLTVAIEQPRQSDFGELAVPAAFQLAKQLRQAPKKIATELAEEIGPISGVASMEVAGNGYINIRIDRGAYGAALLRGDNDEPEGSGEKIIVEHTNINPNKAAHIGHVRNAVLGDTFVRMLRAGGYNVEVQNYIDNTGVQVADVVVGFYHLENKNAAEVKALIADPAVRFDYYCWDLYARISQHYKDNPESLAWRSAMLHSIEAGEGESAEVAVVVADAIVNAHLATMLRLDIEYDVLPRESEILHLQFWAAAFELLKQRNAIYFETEGKLKGCWVMPGLSEEGKVIVRSDGTVVYTGKDIAYQLWKFGLLGKDFYYRPWTTYPDGRVLWATTDQPAEAGHEFGHGWKVYNVIDTRQSYLQDVVVSGLRALGYNDQADRSTHFNYEMVALSPRCCADLGIPLSEEDRKRPYVEVSGRKGLGVKADDLIDTLIAKALEEVQSRNQDVPEEQNRRIATQIAVGALRYFLLKFTRNTVIAFDLQEALAFVGETGPYVQYTAVRASKVLKKLAERGEAMPDFAAELSPEALARQLASEDFWQILLAASKADSALAAALTAGEPSHVARYAFQLAQTFANFYEKYPIIHQENREKKVFLLWMTDFFRRQMVRTAGVLGIPIPEYM